MNFLKKLGQIAAQGLQIALGVVPFAAPILNQVSPGLGAQVSTVANQLNLVAGAVMQIEVAAANLAASGTQLTGPQKLIMASPLVEQIILSSDLLAKHKITDPVKFKAGIDKITGGVADVLSSLEDKVDTTNKA